MKFPKHLLTPEKMSQAYSYNEFSCRALSTPQIKDRARMEKKKLIWADLTMRIQKFQNSITHLVTSPLPSSHLGPLFSTSNLFPDLSWAIPSSCHTISLLPFTPVHTGWSTYCIHCRFKPMPNSPFSQASAQTTHQPTTTYIPKFSLNPHSSDFPAPLNTSDYPLCIKVLFSAGFYNPTPFFLYLSNSSFSSFRSLSTGFLQISDSELYFLLYTLVQDSTPSSPAPIAS